MRIIYVLTLIFLVVVIGVFAVQNRELISLRFLDRSVSSPASVMILVIYLLGMVSGWTMVGLVGRLFRRVS